MCPSWVALIREATVIDSPCTAPETGSTRSLMQSAGEAATTTNKQGGSNEGNRTPATRSKGTLATDRRCRYDAELYSQVIDQEAMETVVAKKDRLAMAQAGD